MPAKRREPVDRRREPSEFVRRAAAQGETRTAVPHASLKRRAMGLMKQSLRTDLFRPAVQPHDVEEVFVARRFNFVEAEGPLDVPAAPEPVREAPRRRPVAQEGRAEPRIVPGEDDILEEEEADLDLPPPSGRPLEANQALDLPDLDEYDGSDLFDQEDPDMAAEPIIPAESRTELPSALRNKRNYYENSDEARKGGLLGGIIPGSGRPAAKPGPKRR
jgi:hypothetical protein